MYKTRGVSASEVTYGVSDGALNSTHSVTYQEWWNFTAFRAVIMVAKET